MALPKVTVRGRNVVLLSGFETESAIDRRASPKLVVKAKENLSLAALREPDAVAFGFVAGRWVAVA